MALWTNSASSSCSTSMKETHGLTSDENVITLGTRMTHCGVERGMLMVSLLLVVMLMRSSVMLVRSACH